jgi:hypothetical protein
MAKKCAAHSGQFLVALDECSLPNDLLDHLHANDSLRPEQSAKQVF